MQGGNPSKEQFAGLKQQTCFEDCDFRT